MVERSIAKLEKKQKQKQKNGSLHEIANLFSAHVQFSASRVIIHLVSPLPDLGKMTAHE